MPRFFTSAVQFDEAASVGSAVIDGEDGRHIARSLRMHTGDALTLSDGAGTDYTGEIESITGDTVMVRLTDKFKNRSEPTLRVTLYPGMPKADKLELITQKAVELGVTSTMPSSSARLVIADVQLESVAPIMAEFPAAIPSIPSFRLAPFDTAVTTMIVTMTNKIHPAVCACSPMKETKSA